MSEQLTRIIGRLKQNQDSPFFIVKAEDIDAADINNNSTLYPDTSLSSFLRHMQTQVGAMAGGVISIIDFKITNIPNGIAELGSVQDVQLEWKLSRQPTQIFLTINDEERIELNPTVSNYTAHNINSNTSWSLQVYENGVSSLVRKITLYFLPPVYYGTMLAKNNTLPNVDDLTYKLIAGTQFSFNPKFYTNEETACIALPEGSTPIVTIDGIVYKWTPCNSIAVQLNSQVNMIYKLWKHPQVMQSDDIWIDIQYS